MINTDFYNKVRARKRNWEVISPATQSCRPGAERTLSKALGIMALELPVGDLIYSAIETHQEIPEDVISLLRSNAEDEVKHDQQLTKLAQAFPHFQKEDEDYVNNNFVPEAYRLAEKYSPVTVAGALEASIFFVILPMYRRLGTGGFRTVAGDISRDENPHVMTNVNLSKDLGWGRGEEINSLRKEVIDWLTSDLDGEGIMSRQYWADSSESLYFNEKAPQLADTKRKVYTAFFEYDNRNLPKYGQ